jgi:hypothetical protein
MGTKVAPERRIKAGGAVYRGSGFISIGDASLVSLVIFALGYPLNLMLADDFTLIRCIANVHLIPLRLVLAK